MAEVTGSMLDHLYDVLLSRRDGDPSLSYSAKLFAGGRGKIAQKLGEEAVETVIAALTESPNQVISESADLLYHLLMLWADCGVAPQDVWRELEKRSGQSGIAEKKSRKKEG